MMERAHDPELKIAERYFLGELTDDEAEAFEAHYFECPRCAEYVVEEQAMLENGREVARTLHQAPPANVVPIDSGRRRQWLSAAAAAILVLAIGAPMLTRDRNEPAVDFVQPHRIQFSLDRAAAPRPLIFPEGTPIALDVEIPPEDFPRFVVSIRDRANDVVSSERAVSADQASEPVFVVLSELSAGTYDVVIEGVREDGSRSPVRRQPFEVRGGSRQEGEP